MAIPADSQLSPSAATRSPIRVMRPIIFLLFFASGISGLIYEVVWSRHLIYLFGATIYAVSTVLAAFMGGLALGSYTFGKLADRCERNLRFYGFLELGIGIAALLLPVFLSLLNPIYTLVYSQFNASFFVLSLLRFGLTFFVLLIPTTLMGGTLPVLARFLVREQRTLGLNVGALYSLNTFGAVVGCFVSGFLLIAWLGIRNTTLLAAAINWGVAVVAIAMSRKLERPSPGATASSSQHTCPESTAVHPPQAPASSPRYPERIVSWILGIYLISGFAALAYQVAWSRALVFTFELMKNTTYAFTAMLTTFLIGLAIGSAITSRIIDRQQDPLRLFALIQILTGLAGAFSLLVIYNAYSLNPFAALDKTTGNIIWWAAVLNVFAKTGAAIFLPTLLMGMAFPVAAKICIESVRRVGFGVGRLYSLNTVGAILGAFAAGFILIPLLGIARGITLLASINIVLGIVVISINPYMRQNRKIVATVLCLAMLLVISARMSRQIRFQQLDEGQKLLFYKEGPLATVSVVKSLLGYNTLYIDNIGVAGTDRILLTDQKSLAHIPMLLLPNPRTALTVGFGSGGASWSYTRYPQLARIDCVEICQTVLDAASLLRASNHGILELNDPRFNLVIDDVRSYLRFANMQYDVIATDCTDLRYKTNANLYDYEYFTLCRQHLTDDGMVVVWMPLAGLSDEAFRVALRTFYRVFPHMAIWYMNNEATHYILLLGTPRPLRFDYQRMEQRLSDPRVKDDLAELYLDDVDKVLSCFVTNEQQLEDFLEGQMINSENFPYLEFEAPKYGYGEQALVDNIRCLFQLRTQVTSLLTNVPEMHRVTEQLALYLDAVPHIIDGHIHYRELELQEACRSYLRASAINPADRSVKHLLNFEELRRRIRALPQEIWGRMQMGHMLLLQERYGDAIDFFRPIAEIEIAETLPSDQRETLTNVLFEAVVSIGKCYQGAGFTEKARQYFSQALAIRPNDPEVQLLLEQVSSPSANATTQ